MRDKVGLTHRAPVREPVVVHIDRVFLLAAPSEDVGEVRRCHAT